MRRMRRRPTGFGPGILSTVLIVLVVALLVGTAPLPTIARAAHDRVDARPVDSATPSNSVTPSVAAPSAAMPNLAGVWTTDTGDTFEIDQTPGDASISSKLLNDTCTWGQRDFLLQGTLEGDALNGTSEQCSSKDSPLVTNCSLDAIWQTPFFSNVSDDQVVGQYRGEYWTWDVAPNGTWVNCTLDHYYMADFTYDRIDCSVLTFDQLAVRYASDVTDAASAVALATQFEGGQKLAWTDAQQAPGGFKDQVTRFQKALTDYGYSSTVNSAYRPVLYQAHFANLRLCNLQMEHEVIDDPGRAPYLAASVAKVNAEVDKHGIKGSIDTVAGITFKIPFICYREPLTGCPHVNEHAVDLSIPNNPGVDWLAAMYGFCRPYLAADPVHWEYISASPWGNPKCAAAGVGPGNADIHIQGNSPVNLLVTDVSGNRIGYDPVSGETVNDFGSGLAYYSGPGTHPQIVDLPGEVTGPGNYSISGVGTGNGSYTITVEAVASSGEVVDSENTTGMASANEPITSVPFELRPDYSPPTLWTVGEPTSSDSSGADFSLGVGGSSYSVRLVGLSSSHVMFSEVGKALAIENDGSSGSTAVTVPSGLLSGTITVRADGVSLPFTSSSGDDGPQYTFDRPAGSTVLTVEGTQALSSTPASSPPALGASAALLLVILAVAVVAAVVGVVYWRRRRGKQPPPVPPPTAT